MSHMVLSSRKLLGGVGGILRTMTDSSSGLGGELSLGIIFGVGMLQCWKLFQIHKAKLSTKMP